MPLPAGYSIVSAESSSELQSFARLALGYSKWLGVDLCFQAFEQELASLPGCYSAPRGCILLLQHQPAPDQPAVAVGCVAVRPLNSNHSAQTAVASHDGKGQLQDDSETRQQDSNLVNEQQQQPEQQPEQLEQQQQQQQQQPGELSVPADSHHRPDMTHMTSTPQSSAQAGAADLNNMCEMKRLWVQPAYNGRGLGKALAAAAVAAARQCGYSHMVLDTLDTLTAANKLYKGLGFVQRRPYYHNPLPGVVYWQLEL